MQTRYEHRDLTWIDLESPTRDEVQRIVDEFGIDLLVGEELLLPSTRPRIDYHPEYLYVVLRFPALRHSHKTREQEVDFVIGKNFLITTHYEMIDPLHKFSKVMEVNAVLDRDLLGDHAGFLFFYVLKKLYKAIEHELEYTHHDLTIVEEHIFSGREAEMVRAISRVARDLLNLRQTIEPHREVLQSLEAEGPRFFGADFLPYLRALGSEYYRVHNHVMRQTDSLHELRETNNSLLSTKENETMRVLTLMALLTFPLSLVVAILDMNAVANPIIGTPYDFWIITGLIAAGALSMLALYKRKGWL